MDSRRLRRTGRTPIEDTAKEYRRQQSDHTQAAVLLFCRKSLLQWESPRSDRADSHHPCTVRSASFIFLTYSPTYFGASFPCSSISLTIAEPTIAPSEMSAIFFACSGVDMPKPIAHGTSVFFRTTSVMEARSVFISLLIPVTPRLDTI